MKFRRRRSDTVGKETFPYGSKQTIAPKAGVLLKGGTADEQAWRNHAIGENPKADRRKAKAVKPAPKKTPQITPIAKNKSAIRVGYDPYESGAIVKPKNPGTRRNLRELGMWLKSQSRAKKDKV
jgi:hypothetical protein